MRMEEINAKALERFDNDRYKLANVIFVRCEQLQAGAKPLVQIDVKKNKLADIAMMEVAEGKILLKSIDANI